MEKHINFYFILLEKSTVLSFFFVFEKDYLILDTGWLFFTKYFESSWKKIALKHKALSIFSFLL